MLDLTKEGMLIADWILLCLALFVGSLYFVVHYAKSLRLEPSGLLSFARKNPKIFLVSFLLSALSILKSSFYDPVSEILDLFYRHMGIICHLIDPATFFPFLFAKLMVL